MTSREACGLLWRLGWPVAVTGQLAVLADGINIYWLGRLLGSDALAAEATLRPVVHGIQWTLMSIATGVSVLVAQSVGARDGRGLVYAASGVRMVVVAWIVLAVVVLPFAQPLASALAPADVPPGNLLELGVPSVLLMTPALGLVLVVLNVATGAGWTRLSTGRMAVDLCATAVLVPIFIEVFGLGLAGAPLAQAFVQLVLVALVWRTLYAHRERWHLGDTTRSRELLPQWRAILAIGLPIQIARIAMFASYTYLVQRVAVDGRATVVGFGIALMLLSFATTFVASVGRAVGIAVAQAVGANDRARVSVLLRAGLVLGTVVGAAAALVSYVLADDLVALLVSEPAAIARGGDSLRILALALIPLGSAVVYMFALTAIKASRVAAAVGITSDAIGVVVAVMWPSDDRLAAASWSIVVSTSLRSVVYALSTRTLIARSGTLKT